jgi:cytochrome c peroxidase
MPNRRSKGPGPVARAGRSSAACALLIAASGWALLTLAVPAASPRDAGPAEPIAPLPLTVAVDRDRAALGERLFHDPRLSGDGRRSCATCHPIDRGGMDGVTRSAMAGGEPHPRNTPTVFNVGFSAYLNWDGAATSLEAHAEGVLLNPGLMNARWPDLLGRLRGDGDDAARFRAAYTDGVTRANVLDALATFERSLATPNARVDRYLRGEREALSDAEQRGYRLFKSYGCASCHQGVNAGGNLFQKFGIFADPDGAWASGASGDGAGPARRGAEGRAGDGGADPGRYGVTGVPRDRGVFRVPGLRNVAVTAPYFHDGRARTLEVAVDTMARVQLGRQLAPDEIAAIVAFLGALTGEYRGRPVGVAPAGAR